MRLTTKVVIGLSTAIFIALMIRTNVVSNLWSSTTGQGYVIPSESSIFTFKATKMNNGSGEWWLYAEDYNYYYSMEKAGIDKPYILISKSRAKGIPKFDKHDYKTWEKEPTTAGKMKDWNTYFKNLYRNFNERNIDFVINNMTTEVKWANGMDGGFVYGHEGVREYWTRQFTLVSSQVTPLNVREENGKIIINVHQVVRDLEGKLLADETVTHIFNMDGDKITQFDIMK